MGRIATTIELAKSSWAVLKADKELLLLPVLSGLATIAVAASFLIPLFDTFEGDAASGTTYALTFLMYLVLAYITIFFNAALIHAANERLNGGDPTLGSALAGAATRAGRILPWAVVSATVSLILRAIEERAGFLGRFVAGLAGLAWSVVTFLVLPILVIENVGVGDAVSRSSTLFKRTWGENLAAQLGFGLLGMIASIPGVLLVVVAAQAPGGGSRTLFIAALVWLILVAVVLTALSGIFQTALYHYAVSGDVPGGYFEPGQLSQAFRPKRR